MLKGQRRILLILLLPALILLFFVIIFPIAFSYYVSFMRFLIFEFKVSAFMGARNYIDTLTSMRFWHSLQFTTMFVVLAVALEFILGLGFALLFNREIKGGRFLRTLILTPMVLAPIVVSMLWKYIFHENVGILNYVLHNFGLPEPAWFSTAPYAFFATIIIDVWEWTPFMFLVLSAGLASLPSEPYEAALIDGASKSQVFRYITLPLLKPIIFIAVMLAAMRAIKVFDILYVTTRGGPGIYTESITFYIFNMTLARGHVDVGCAVSIITLFIVFGLFTVYLKYRPSM